MTGFLVTGGAGFIGAALVKRLAKDGHAVRVLDKGSWRSAHRLAEVMDGIDYIEADVRCAEAVFRAARGVESIIHLAAVTGDGPSRRRPAVVLDVGVRGMLTVLDACRRVGVGELFVASSPEVYQTPPAGPADETAPLVIPDVLNPRHSYAGSKAIAELMAFNYGRKDFDRVVVFRPHNVYGPDMGCQHVIARLIERAVTAIRATPAGPVPFPVPGGDRQTRAFTHIDDVVDALAVLIDRGRHMNVYHIGNPEESTLAEVARKVVAILGREADTLSGETLSGATERRCPDISKLRALGFDPHVSLDAGLPGVVSWYADASREEDPPLTSPTGGTAPLRVLSAGNDWRV